MLHNQLAYKKKSNFGLTGCFSLHPLKNFMFIDGGMLTTNDKKIYNYVKIRNHGLVNRDTAVL